MTFPMKRKIKKNIFRFSLRRKCHVIYNNSDQTKRIIPFFFPQFPYNRIFSILVICFDIDYIFIYSFFLRLMYVTASILNISLIFMSWRLCSFSFLSHQLGNVDVTWLWHFFFLHSSFVCWFYVKHLKFIQYDGIQSMKYKCFCSSRRVPIIIASFFLLMIYSLWFKTVIHHTKMNF